jgi:cellobiose phosphorylase
VASASGLSFELNANGAVRRIDHGDVTINLFLGNEAEGGLANIHLRLLDGQPESIPLIGPRSLSAHRIEADGLSASGTWKGLFYQVRLALSASSPAWFWHVRVENRSGVARRCDLIHTQDIGIAHYGAIRLNEYYVSQYVDHTPLDHPRAGTVVASRQNQPVGGRCPWTVIGSLKRGVSHATDALQFFGLAARKGERPPGLTEGLPGTRLQHEHSLVCIQDEAFDLAPGESSDRGFFASFNPDHPAATSASDLADVDAVLALSEAISPARVACEATAADDEPHPGVTRPYGYCNTPSIFATAPLLETGDLDAACIARFFGAERRHEEWADGNLLSFFAADGSHVVLKAKEAIVLRPHGQILRTGSALMPDESALTTTSWMNGVFHSMITQGHVSINRFLSTCHTYLGLFRSHGQRIFIESKDGWHLLDMPSAFAMSPSSCRWIYRHPEGLLEVVSNAPENRHRLELSIRVIEGPPARFLVSHHVAIHGDDGSGSVPLRWEETDGGVLVLPVPESDVGRRFPNGGFFVKPVDETVLELVGDDALLFTDGHSRSQPFLCFVTAPSLTASLAIEGRLVPPSSPGDDGFWQKVAAAPQITAADPHVAAIGEFFPWLVQNALVHFLSPRGLEQYSGGGWGTRDVCQGPVELLLALGRFEPIRDLLLRVFRQQNPDGDWPQWFMFFERERNIRPGDSHGDIVYWPVLALAQYLIASGDASILDERVPFFQFEEANGSAETISHHIDVALELILRRVIPGTTLAAYGHGDWNDSLQPARPEMRERLCSSWTVTLCHQTLVTLAEAMRRIGQSARAGELDALAANILEEFQRVLIVDDVLTGLAYFHENGSTDLLLHPRDRQTDLSYSLLPMIHAVINDMFTPRQAEAHLALIRSHLTGPDGARLFDKPMAYHGGPMSFFQRAESSSFFGREIGIMYTHAHLRYCEALHRHGDADEFLLNLRKIIPIGMRDLVPSATPRQTNCYYSSSDASFADRYVADADYPKALNGEVPLEGGWRVYSSGAGIGTRLIIQCFLGITIEHDSVIIDPVLPASLDGMSVRMTVSGREIRITYRVDRTGRGPVSVNLNGEDLDFVHLPNPYRTGAARIPRKTFESALTGSDDSLVVWLE